jgi:hypothetical protein
MTTTFLRRLACVVLGCVIVVLGAEVFSAVDGERLDPFSIVMTMRPDYLWRCTKQMEAGG